MDIPDDFMVHIASGEGDVHYVPMLDAARRAMVVTPRSASPVMLRPVPSTIHRVWYGPRSHSSIGFKKNGMWMRSSASVPAIPIKRTRALRTATTTGRQPLLSSIPAKELPATNFFSVMLGQRSIDEREASGSNFMSLRKLSLNALSATSSINYNELGDSATARLHGGTRRGRNKKKKKMMMMRKGGSDHAIVNESGQGSRSLRPSTTVPGLLRRSSTASEKRLRQPTR